MKRKLHHSLIAMSATLTVLTVLVVAGGPVMSVPPAPSLTVASIKADGQQVAPTLSTTGREATGAPDSRRRHLRKSRAALALPYFSFAQGLRRNRS